MLPYRPYRRNLWRVIEGQYRPATLKIVDTIAEQAALEALIEESKPPVPPECVHLDFQFRSPFRYGRYPGNSRFRRQGRTLGVYYASEAALTAALETAWGRVRFFRNAPGAPLPSAPTTHTAILADIQVAAALDLTEPEVAALGNWTDPDDYSACCALADRVREEGGEAIRYASVRDPGGGRNVAVLTCRGFAQPAPIQTQTWHLYTTDTRVVLTNETLRQTHELTIAAKAFA